MRNAFDKQIMSQEVTVNLKINNFKVYPSFCLFTFLLRGLRFRLIQSIHFQAEQRGTIEHYRDRSRS